MNQDDFLAIVTELLADDGLKLNRQETRNVVNAVFRAITNGLLEKDSVAIRGFGIFKAVFQQTKTVRSPATGDSIVVPERYVPKFKAALGLKEKIAEKSGQEK